MKVLISLIACLVLASCSISVTNVASQGTASDVVDEKQQTEADFHPDFSLPL